jgi:hypothetical protein
VPVTQSTDQMLKEPSYPSHSLTNLGIIILEQLGIETILYRQAH